MLPERLKRYFRADSIDTTTCAYNRTLSLSTSNSMFPQFKHCFHVSDLLFCASHVLPVPPYGENNDRQRHAGSNENVQMTVPGRKAIVTAAMVIMEAESCCVCSAIFAVSTAVR